MAPATRSRQLPRLTFPAPPAAGRRGVPAVELERVARACAARGPAPAERGRGGRRSSTRQGIALTIADLRRAESTGAIGLALAAWLADIYGTTTDGLAGRRLHRRRPSLDDFPSGRVARGASGLRKSGTRVRTGCARPHVRSVQLGPHVRRTCRTPRSSREAGSKRSMQDRSFAPPSPSRPAMTAAAQPPDPTERHRLLVDVRGGRRAGAQAPGRGHP